MSHGRYEMSATDGYIQQDVDNNQKPKPTMDLTATVKEDDSEAPKTQNNKDDDAEACSASNITLASQFPDEPITMEDMHRMFLQPSAQESMQKIIDLAKSGFFDEVKRPSDRKKSGNFQRRGKNRRN